VSAFKEYSNYYDLLYRDKDYAGEARYVHELIQKQNPGAVSVLDLGCGSGRHDREFAKLGYQVAGIDLAEGMLEVARSVTDDLLGVEYYLGDICTVRLGRCFDAVISLFHVMSYNITNNDLLAAFNTASFHLNSGGVFVFDCWYGPGVLTDRPSERVKKLKGDTFSVVRYATPVLYPNENVVDVNYRVVINNNHDIDSKELNESHRMRYLFYPEVELLLNLAGFSVEVFEEWLTGSPCDFGTWNAVFVCRKL
jgi:SAM-dependent methyltransferase